MFALEIANFCKETAGVLQMVGWALTIFKCLIPLIIVAYGMIDFGKAVVASKDDEMKAAGKRLGMRAAAGIIIFFIPTIVMWLFDTGISIGKEDSAGFDNCKDCILHPGSSNKCRVSD